MEKTTISVTSRMRCRIKESKVYAMSDNAFGSIFGPSTPGALNLVAAD